MSRFSRATRISPLSLYRHQLRRAWLCFWLTWLLLGVGGYVLTVRILRPQVVSQGCLEGFWVAREAAQGESSPLPLSMPEPELHWEMPPLPEPVLSPEQAEPVDMPESEAASVLPLLEVADALPMEEAPSHRLRAARATGRSTPRAAASAASAAPAAPAAAEGDYTPPAYRRAPKPPYPAAMRQSRVEGSVRLRIHIDAEGVPQQVELVGSSGHAAFDRAAADWVARHWLFEPARRGGSAVPGVVVTSVRFVLQ